MWPAALPRDCLTSTLSLEHSPTWKFSAELSLSPILRFLINRNFPPVLNMQWTSLYCLSMCIIWHLAIPTGVSVSHRKGTGSLPAVHSLPCIRYWEEPTGHGKKAHATDAELARSTLLSLNKALFIPVLMCWVILGNSEPVKEVVDQVCGLLVGGRHCYTFCYSPHGRESSLGIGNQIFLLYKMLNGETMLCP